MNKCVGYQRQTYELFNNNSDYRVNLLIGRLNLINLVLATTHNLSHVCLYNLTDLTSNYHNTNLNDFLIVHIRYPLSSNYFMQFVPHFLTTSHIL